MKQLSIAENIRRLRLGKGLTQEGLAARLGVACQTVSKWENSLTAPDITLLPVLAELFQVSVDELLGYDGKARRAEIEALSQKAWERRSKGDHAGARQILREGLARFPGDEVLLNCLLYSTGDADERIRLASGLAETAADVEVRYDALRILAEEYGKREQYELARAALEKLPELYFTKLEIAAQALSGEEKQDSARRQKWLSLESLVSMTVELARYYEEAGRSEEAKSERALAAALPELFAKQLEETEPLRELLAELRREAVRTTRRYWFDD